MADLWGIPGQILRDAERLSGIVCGALQAAGMKILGAPLVHRFQEGGQGVTGAVLLRQSHATFHTYPESGCLMLDVYACGEADPDAVLHAIVAGLEPAAVDRVLLHRGSLRAPDGISR